MSEMLRINLSDRSIQKGQIPVEYQGLGGRGFTSAVISAEVDPLCHPLSADNKLVLAAGLLAGTSIPSSGRASFGGKSPLTGTIKESNFGGALGTKLGRLGLQGIVLEGKATDWIVLLIDKDGARFEDAMELEDTLIYECAARLRAKYGEHVAIAAIGPAGEARMKAACIGATDLEGLPTRQAGRGGLGALMGRPPILVPA